MSTYFIEEFSNDNEDYNYGELIVIEQLFSQVYQIHYSDTKVDFEILSNKADSGIKSIKSFMNENKKRSELMEKYIKFREAEFYYYAGWNLIKDNKEKSIWMLEKAIDIYSDIASLFKVEVDNITKTHIKGDRRLSAYFYNTIGSCYNQIGNPKNNDIAECYCSYAANLEKNHNSYYRNYGIALENNDKKEEAKEQYIKAFEINHNLKTLHCIISIIDKMINDNLNIKYPISYKEERSPKLGSSEHIEKINIDFNKIKEELNELEKYCKILKSLFPMSIDNFIYMTIYYRDSIIVDLCKKDNSKILEYIKLAENELIVLESIAKDNPLTKILRKDIDTLKNNNI